ncbi:MAG: hypothetical protein HY953_09795 [Candidatus Rokubacteria bacterium]|nr:hypothetical protein [Candidatus Rokubacteria bacterium]
MEYYLDTATPSEHPLGDAALDQQARHRRPYRRERALHEVAGGRYDT